MNLLITPQEFPIVEVILQPQPILQSTVEVIGLPGPPGPQGPQGIAGSSIAAHYEWKPSTVASDPAHGYMKSNFFPVSGSAEFYASVYDQQGSVVRFDLMNIGETFTIYEMGLFETWDTYEITGPIVINSSEWFTIPATFVESGPLAFTPGTNTDIEVRTQIQGIPGPPGEPGTIVHVGPTPPDSPALNALWVDTS